MRARLAVALTLAAVVVLQALPGGAAGDTTHALMADRSIGYVRTPALEALLRANRDPFLSGALYPDSGYWTRGAGVPGGDYGEVSHWEGFINAYVAHVRAKPECAGTIASANGPCAAMIAHLLGAAAHGMGDEVWDWMFEPLVTDHGEAPDHPIASGDPLGSVPPGSLINSIEYAMDMIAIRDHALWGEIPHYVPSTDDLVAVYRSVGRDDITAEAILAGQAMETSIMAAERFGAAVDGDRVRLQMPWSASHYYSESGGVLWAARAVSGYLEGIWRKLLAPEGVHPRPEIVAVHPDHGETGVPWQWLPARTSPGPETGGGENRIIAVLSNSLDPAWVGGSLVLLDPDGIEVTPRAGFPKAGPWGPDGTHSVLFYPASDLTPCSVYMAIVTTRLQDHAGASPAREFAWRFETRAADGGSCA